MKAYRVTLYTKGFYKYVNTLDQAIEVAGPLHFEGPEEGPEPGKPWWGYEGEESSQTGPARAQIELVDLPD